MLKLMAAKSIYQTKSLMFYICYIQIPMLLLRKSKFMKRYGMSRQLGAAMLLRILSFRLGNGSKLL